MESPPISPRQSGEILNPPQRDRASARAAEEPLAPPAPPHLSEVQLMMRSEFEPMVRMKWGREEKGVFHLKLLEEGYVSPRFNGLNGWDGAVCIRGSDGSEGRISLVRARLFVPTLFPKIEQIPKGSSLTLRYDVENWTLKMEDIHPRVFMPGFSFLGEQILLVRPEDRVADKGYFMVNRPGSNGPLFLTSSMIRELFQALQLKYKFGKWSAPFITYEKQGGAGTLTLRVDQSRWSFVLDNLLSGSFDRGSLEFVLQIHPLRVKLIQTVPVADLSSRRSGPGGIVRLRNPKGGVSPRGEKGKFLTWTASRRPVSTAELEAFAREEQQRLRGGTEAPTRQRSSGAGPAKPPPVKRDWRQDACERTISVGRERLFYPLDTPPGENSRLRISWDGDVDVYLGELEAARLLGALSVHSLLGQIRDVTYWSKEQRLEMKVPDAALEGFCRGYKNKCHAQTTLNWDTIAASLTLTYDISRAYLGR